MEVVWVHDQDSQCRDQASGVCGTAGVLHGVVVALGVKLHRQQHKMGQLVCVTAVLSCACTVRCEVRRDAWRQGCW